MQRLLSDSSWYTELSSRSVFELDYEQTILAHAALLFPGYIAANFKAKVTSYEGNVQADLALVDRQLRGWTVVEVELEHHPLSGHVEPQVRKLLHGEYGTLHADALGRSMPTLDQRALRSLVLSSQPEVMVIVPDEPPDWRATLANIGAKIGVIKVYMDGRGKRILSRSGDSPREYAPELVTLLKPSRSLPRSLEVQSPGALTTDSRLALHYQGQLTLWRQIRTGRTAFLTPEGPYGIETDVARTYEIIRQEQDGELILRG